jgi:hypothetical protein
MGDASAVRTHPAEAREQRLDDARQAGGTAKNPLRPVP